MGGGVLLLADLAIAALTVVQFGAQVLLLSLGGVGFDNPGMLARALISLLVQGAFAVAVAVILAGVLGLLHRFGGADTGRPRGLMTAHFFGALIASAVLASTPAWRRYPGTWRCL